MKRLISVILILCILISAAPAPVLSLNYAPQDLTDLQSEPSFDFDFLPPGSRWMELVNGIEPARFTPQYQLADNVISLKDTKVTENLADMGQLLSGSMIQKLSPKKIIEKGGYVPKDVLNLAAQQAGKKIESGSVVVDTQSGTAFKVVSPTVYSGIFDTDPELNQMVKPLENTYALTKPELHEVIKDFKLDQEVKLTKANITGFALNVEDSIKMNPKALLLGVGDEDKVFKTLTGDNLIEFEFKDTALHGKVGNSTIDVKLSGGFAIGNIDLKGRYSSMGGYEISMSLQQESYVVVELDAEVHEEIKVPILGITIPFGVGEVYGGIFAIIGMDGEFRLGIEARETTGCRMGIEGSTFLYVPVSFHPIFEPEPPKITGDCQMLGKINGYIKFGPMLGIEIFGFDLVGAGVLLGAGVNVQSDGTMLDIELYGSIDVYIELADEYFSLVRERPTIYRKQQPDLHGYRVSFLETYVEPGRVGGIIEEEPKESGAAYISSENRDYKIWIVPGIIADSFDPSKREALLSSDRNNTSKALKDKVRTYPSDSFAKTNSEGEFFQEDEEICYGGDKIYLEFKAMDGTLIFVGPAKPVLPFKDVTIIHADYFNDYIVGKVEPQRLIKWSSNRLDPNQVQDELVYYKGYIDISPFNDYGYYRENAYTPVAKLIHRPYVVNGLTRTETNSMGEFDTRNPYLENGEVHQGKAIDVLSEDSLNSYVNPDTPPSTIGVLASVRANGEVNNITVFGITPAAPEFQFTRTINQVSGQKIKDGDKIIDRMVFDEYLWISNPAGTRTITADMFDYIVHGFSTQDYKGYYENPVKETRETPISLTPILDANGNPTGTALFSQRVTVEWVWQAHPNPIKITSQDHFEAEAGKEATFKVTANGYFPVFSLQGEPDRVWIGEDDGLLYIPRTLSPGKYTFTIHAKEDNILLPTFAPDPKKGNDPSEPDKQTFTLTISDKPIEPSPSPSLSPSSSLSPKTPSITPKTSNTPAPSPSTTSEPRTAPKITGSQSLTMTRGADDLVTAYTATGSKPIVFSVEARSVSGAPVPGISIDSSGGWLRINKDTPAGYYYINITASNDAGRDTLECGLLVKAPEIRTAPVLDNRRDEYKFKMSAANTEFSVQLNASGSLPLTYSLEPVNARIPVPSEVSIDQSTGLLKVRGGLIGGIKAGAYSFVVRVSNDVGSDTKECFLEVTSAIIPPIRPLAMSTKPEVNLDNPSIKLNQDLFSKEPPPNKLLIRCDDPKDVYTKDREVVNGANYIRWSIEAEVSILDVMVDTSVAKVYSDYTYYDVVTWGDKVIINDNSPVCEQYHYYDPSSKITPPLSKEQLEKIRSDMKKAIEKELSEYKNGYSLNYDISANGLRERYSDFKVNPMDKIVSSLEYGSLIKEMNNKKEGSFTVDLNNDTGTVVAGTYFTSLKNNPKASVSFKQDGAVITFAGSDIKAANENDLFNIGLTFAPHGKAMLDSIGEGYESFAYGFQHHGDLPGMATFAVTTDLSQGTKVNVYKFDSATGEFTLIAGNAAVDSKGVVTYKNNTMSEYVITTKTIKNAAVSEIATGQGNLLRGGSGILIGVTCLAAAIIIGAGLWLFLIKRRKASNHKSAQI